jgi:PPOX class probable F420-dependent enzyme
VTASALDVVGQGRYLRLTTFRRDGRAVPTPVWQVRDGDSLLVMTGGSTGKVKRLRHTTRVLIAASDMRGRVKPGVQDVEGIAVMITDVPELDRLVGLLKDKYGLMFRVSGWVNRLRGQTFDDGVEIRISIPG